MIGRGDTDIDIVRQRLHNHHLLQPPKSRAEDVVHWLLAVQAQDYPAARWGVAQRGEAISGASIDEALASGAILRTHVLRPTWHLVTPADLRWLLELTAARVKALMAYGSRQSGLDEETFAKSNRVLGKALRGGLLLTRVELAAILRPEGIDPPHAIAMGHIMLRAELDGVVCSGGLRGKQHTYALLDERVPAQASRDRDVALSGLAGRFIAARGPATAKDLAWWSGLTVADATAGLNTAQPKLDAISIGGRTYWSRENRPPRGPASGVTAHLLPKFDEYTVAYVDRTTLLDEHAVTKLSEPCDAIFNNVVLVNGRVVGTWKRTLAKASADITLTLFRELESAERRAVDAAAARYGRYLGRSAQVEVRE